MVRMKVLIMGLSGTGKTTLADSAAKELRKLGVKVTRVNGDKVRAETGNKDFTREGRLRQASDMAARCDVDGVVIADFICPTWETMSVFEASRPCDLIVWMDTRSSSAYADTDAMFQYPKVYDAQVMWFYDKLVPDLVERIKSRVGR